MMFVMKKMSLFRIKNLNKINNIIKRNSRVSILIEAVDKPGALYNILKSFQDHSVNLTQIESRPILNKYTDNGVNIFINFEGEIKESKIQLLIKEIRCRYSNLLVLDEKIVPWFPKHISEIDIITDRIVTNNLLTTDHPGFSDLKYRIRRDKLTEISKSCKYGEVIPIIEYSEEEVKTWSLVYSKLRKFHSEFACTEYLQIITDMEKDCEYSQYKIPQAQTISNYLYQKTGFQLKPVTGLLSSRDFLNALAFRVFCSTQYIRHPSRPFYTPEPDICHEYIGHVPMFADKDFADFSQEIGLASLGASDEDIQKLSSCYWFSVEFGLINDKNDNNKVKAYGAGLLSSVEELEYACRSDSKAKLIPWDPQIASVTKYPITSLQPLYFIANSLKDVKDKLRLYCNNLNRPFHARYNKEDNTIWVDRAIKTTSK